MNLKYSVFTVMTPDLSISEVAEALGSLGYDGIEWRVAETNKIDVIDYHTGNKATISFKRLLDEAENIKELSEANNLKVIALGTYIPPEDVCGVEKAMKAANLMDCPQIRVRIQRYYRRENYNKLFNKALESIEKIEPLAKDYGVKINIELHPGSVCPSASSAYRIVSNFEPENIGVIFDPGNMIIEGYDDWLLGLELLGPYLSYLHVKNCMLQRVSDEGRVRWRHVWCDLDKGLVDWLDVLKSLKKTGHEEVWLSFEDFSERKTMTKLRENLDFMRKLERRIK